MLDICVAFCVVFSVLGVFILCLVSVLIKILDFQYLIVAPSVLSNVDHIIYNIVENIYIGYGCGPSLWYHLTEFSWTRSYGTYIKYLS